MGRATMEVEKATVEVVRAVEEVVRAVEAVGILGKVGVLKEEEKV